MVCDALLRPLHFVPMYHLLGQGSGWEWPDSAQRPLLIGGTWGLGGGFVMDGA